MDKCPRCGSMMFTQKFYHKHESFIGEKCFMCCEILDDVILANRNYQKPIKKPPSRQGEVPKISDCPDKELFIESSLDDLVSKYGINNYAPIYRERTRRVGLNEVPEEILRKYKNRKGKAVHKSRKVVKKRVLPESKKTTE